MEQAKSRIAAAVLTGTALAGCAAQAPLSVPAAILSEEWSQPVTGGTVAGDAGTPAALGTLLGDVRLAELIARAQANNPNIAIARARVEQARARLKGARAASQPEFSVNGAVDNQLNLRGNRGLGAGSIPLGLTLSWDPDVFGRLKAERAGSAARFDAARWDARQAQLQVEVEMASAWVQRAVLARRIAILDEQIARAAELERIVRVRFDAGDATRVDLGLQSIRLLDLKRDRTRIVQALEETRSAIAVLAGAEAPLFRSEVAAVSDLTLPEIALPAPALLLLQRPDVRAAEALIAAANGDVTAARARFFPSFEVSIAGLAEIISGGALRSSVSSSTSFLAPIFARGALTRDLQVAQAEQVEAAETYRRTILSALEQVENLLLAADMARHRTALVDRIVAEARITARLGNAQFLSGEEDLQVLLDAEELLGEAEEAQVLVWEEAMLAQIGLYGAKGGDRSGL